MASYKQLDLTLLVMSSRIAVCFDFSVCMFSLIDLSISLFIIMINKKSLGLSPDIILK